MTHACHEIYFIALTCGPLTEIQSVMLSKQDQVLQHFRSGLIAPFGA